MLARISTRFRDNGTRNFLCNNGIRTLLRFQYPLATAAASRNHTFSLLGFSRDKAISTTDKLFVICGPCSLLRYSTSAAVASQNLLISHYLIKSLGFSKDEAISATAKLKSLKSPKNPDLVIKFLQEIGLGRTEIKKIVSISPRLLCADVNKTLKPKFQCLQEIGICGSDLVKLFIGDGHTLFRGLDSHLRPNLEYLKKLFSSDEILVKAIKKSPWLLSSNGPKRIEPKFVLLQEAGFTNAKIEKLVLQRPRLLLQKVEWLEEILHRVEKVFHISPNSGMFFHGVIALVSLSKSTLEKKMRIFRSFGWCDSDIMAMYRKQPRCLGISEDKIQQVLNFFMRELGYKPDYLVRAPALLMLSLEKRVIPRNEVLKVLRDKKLSHKISFARAMYVSESKFCSEYVLPYKDEVPNLYESYVTSIRH